MVSMIELPDECNPGSVEAYRAFRDKFNELKKEYPDWNFQFVPCSFKQIPGDNNLHVTSFMAIHL